MRAPAPLLLLLAACTAPDPARAPGYELPDAPAEADAPDDDAADTDAVEATCEAGIAWLVPDREAELVPVDDPVRVGFTAPVADGDWELRLVGVPGVALLAGDARSATFTPDVPLAVDRPYVLEARACGERADTTFTTTGPRVPPEALPGRTWTLDLDAGTWVAPGVASLFAPLLDLGLAFLRAELDEDGEVHLRVWTHDAGDDLGLASCDEAYDLGPLDLSENPRFRTLDPRPAPTSRGSANLLDDLHVEGLFADGGERVERVSLYARLDVAVVERLTGLDDLCDVAARLGDRCVPCSNGVSSCLEAVVSDIEGGPSNPASAQPPPCGPAD